MQIQIKKPVAILGFGNEGQAAYEFLKSQKIEDISICDQKTIDTPEGTHTILGSDAFKDLTKFKTIIRSPGVHYKTKGIIEAKEAGANVTSMTEMSLEIGRARLTAITGSNGKTSTVAMTEAILKEHYKSLLIVGGNDRKPTVQKMLDNPKTPVLMEVSSFQFADLKTSPHISAILNISPNHLDWHENMEDYVNAKQNLIAHQNQNDWAVLNANDENSSKMGEHAPGKIFWIGKKKGVNYILWENDQLIGKIQGRDLKIMDKNEITLKTHPDNIAFAAAIGLIHGAEENLIKASLKTASGVEHRLEFVKEAKGINFYNDSSCTTPESTAVAIKQFEPHELIIMLGGSSKKADFRFLAGEIVDKKIRVYLFGEEANNLEKAIKEEGGAELIIQNSSSKIFREIVEDVHHLANKGDNVVLSPACASFDMFRNAKERGKEFKKIVNEI